MLTGLIKSVGTGVRFGGLSQIRPGSTWPFVQGAVMCVCLALFVLLWGTRVQAVSPEDRFVACVPAEKSIEIKVTSKTIAATPGRRVWVLTEIPSADQVQLPAGDTVLKERIVGIFQEIVDSGAEVSIGIFANRQSNDPPSLEAQFTFLDTVQPGLELVLPLGLTALPQPADQGQIYTTRICLKYGVIPLPTRVEIQITTLNGASAPLAGMPSLKLADAADRFIGKSEGEIPVIIAYAQQDLDDARKDPALTTDEAASALVKRELLQVAAISFDKAVEKGLLGPSGKPLVHQGSGERAAVQTTGAINENYNLNALSTDVHWGMVRSNAQVRARDTPAATWVISVAGLQFAQSVDIEVTKSPAEMEFDGQEAEKKFDEKRKRVRNRLRADHLAVGAARPLKAKPGHIITAIEINEDKDVLRTGKDVKSVGNFTSGPAPADGALSRQRLIYTVSRQMKAEKTLSLKLGGGYSPEDSLSGTAAVNGANMLGFSETATLSYSGGPQVQKIRFKFDRPFESTETQGWHMKTFGVNVQYFSDKDKRFSNLTAEEIEANETGSEARLSFGYDSFSVVNHALVDCLSHGSHKRTRLYLTATPALGYRDVNIKDDNLLLTITQLDKSLLPQARTQATTLSLEGNLGFSHDFRQPKRSGLGVFKMSLSGRLQRGSRFFGSDYRYNKSYATLSSEIVFGSTSSKDFLLRHNHVMGMSTRGTPIFELFRLGGAQSVRGLEEGEVVGRRMSADQVELGVNLMILRHWITRKPIASAFLKDNCPGDADPSSSKLPFDINNTYLKVFYDRGRIDDRDSFVIPGGLSRVAQGYGIALELRQLGGQNINLSFGYAHSPQSILHKSGTFYTGVSYTR